MQNLISECIRYWELRRLGYNAVLILVVAGSFFYHHSPADLATLTLGGLGGLFVAAVVANVLYCAAYVVDIFLQMSEFRQAWQRCRWLLLGLGTTLAAVLFLLHE